MAKVDGSITKLIQGVSQQPEEVRLPGQSELQENLSSDPVDGLKRRPPVEYISTLFSEVSGTYFTNFKIDGESFIAAIGSNTMRIFDTSGTERTVTFSSGTASYFDGDNMILSASDDVVYALNKSVNTAMQGGTKNYIKDGHAMVFLLGGNYGRKYEITLKWGVNEETATYDSANGGSASHSTLISTENIISNLKTQLEANTTINSAFTINIESDVLHIEHNSSTEFEITVADGSGGQDLFAVNYEIVDESKLPRYAPNGFIVKIVGDSASGADDFYLEFQTDDDSVALGAGFGQPGKWVESVAPDTPYLMDTSTMPHVLIKDGSGNFDVEFEDWKGRQVGDRKAHV